MLDARRDAAQIQDGGRHVPPDLLALDLVQFVPRLVEEFVSRVPDLEHVTAGRLLVVGSEALDTFH